jgi:hypothetical protein
VFHGACADGESPRADRRRRRHPCLGARRAAGSAVSGRAPCRPAVCDHSGRRQDSDTRDFVAELRKINVTPHVARNTGGRRSAIDSRTTRHPGYDVSLRIRKRIEEAFGWSRTVAGLRKARDRAAQNRLAVHLCHGGLQPGASAKTAGGGSVKARSPSERRCVGWKCPLGDRYRSAKASAGQWGRPNAEARRALFSSLLVDPLAAVLHHQQKEIERLINRDSSIKPEVALVWRAGHDLVERGVTELNALRQRMGLRIQEVVVAVHAYEVRQPILE